MLQIKNIEDISKVIETANKMGWNSNVPINLFGTEESWMPFLQYLGELGSSGISTPNINEGKKNGYGDPLPPVYAEILSYGGYNFNIIYLDK